MNPCKRKGPPMVVSRPRTKCSRCTYGHAASDGVGKGKRQPPRGQSPVNDSARKEKRTKEPPTTLQRPHCAYFSSHKSQVFNTSQGTDNIGRKYIHVIGGQRWKLPLLLVPYKNLRASSPLTIHSDSIRNDLAAPANPLMLITKIPRIRCDARVLIQSSCISIWLCDTT